MSHSAFARVALAAHVALGALAALGSSAALAPPAVAESPRAPNLIVILRARVQHRRTRPHRARHAAHRAAAAAVSRRVRLRHRDGGQVAPRRVAAVPSAGARLRRVLRLPARRDPLRRGGHGRDALRRSRAAARRRRAEARSRDTRHFSERPFFWRNSKSWATRQRLWKLIQYDGEPPFLFDLDADVAESRNLATAQSERVAEITRRFREWEKGTIAPLWPMRVTYHVPLQEILDRKPMRLLEKPEPDTIEVEF